MILVDEIIDSHTGTVMKFYFGMDYNIVSSHPKDGSGGLMFCFVEDFNNSKKSFDRDKKIESILDNIIEEDTDIDNNYLFIYQTGKYQEQVYSSIKEKMIKQPDEIPKWMPVGRSISGEIISGNLVKPKPNI